MPVCPADKDGRLLQSRRQLALVRLEQKEKNLKEQAFKTVHHVKAQPETPKRGIVNAIIYYNGKFTAMVDNKIVHEGDRIEGIEILKIHADKIQFKKNRSRWTQKLGETQESFWQ